MVAPASAMFIKVTYKNSYKQSCQLPDTAEVTLLADAEVSAEQSKHCNMQQI